MRQENCSTTFYKTLFFGQRQGSSFAYRWETCRKFCEDIAADKLKKGVEIYVIAIGSGKKVGRKPLARLASNDKNVFYLKSFKNVKKTSE